MKITIFNIHKFNEDGIAIFNSLVRGVQIINWKYKKNTNKNNQV